MCGLSCCTRQTFCSPTHFDGEGKQSWQYPRTCRLAGESAERAEVARGRRGSTSHPGKQKARALIVTQRSVTGNPTTGSWRAREAVERSRVLAGLLHLSARNWPSISATLNTDLLPRRQGFCLSNRRYKAFSYPAQWDIPSRSFLLSTGSNDAGV